MSALRVWMHRDTTGWTSGVERSTSRWTQSRSVEGASFMGAIKHLLVPTGYYVWRYERPDDRGGES